MCTPLLCTPAGTTHHLFTLSSRDEVFRQRCRTTHQRLRFFLDGRRLPATLQNNTSAFTVFSRWQKASWNVAEQHISVYGFFSMAESFLKRCRTTHQRLRFFLDGRRLPETLQNNTSAFTVFSRWQKASWNVAEQHISVYGFFSMAEGFLKRCITTHQRLRFFLDGRRLPETLQTINQLFTVPSRDENFLNNKRSLSRF